MNRARCRLAGLGWFNDLCESNKAMGGVQGGWGVENGDKLLKKMKRQCFVRAAPGLLRPTYPGFPVEVGGVEQEHAAFFGRKPHTRL